MGLPQSVRGGPPAGAPGSAPSGAPDGEPELAFPDEVPASLPRRLAAMLYDGLLVTGIWMLLTFVIVIASNDRVPPAIGFATLVGSAVVFCSFFWVMYGRTLGMQAWNLRLRSGAATANGTATGIGSNHRRVTITQALARFTVLMPGIMLLQGGTYMPVLIIVGLLYFQAAYLWALFNPSRSTWADLFSQTRMVQISTAARHLR